MRTSRNRTNIQGLQMSLSGNHAQAMRPIRLATFRDYLDQRQTLAVSCPGCRRTAACDVAALVTTGLGDRVVVRCRPRCRVCGSLGQLRNVSHAPDPRRVARTGRRGAEAKAVKRRTVPAAVLTRYAQPHGQTTKGQASIASEARDGAPHARPARAEAPQARSGPQSAARPVQYARQGVAGRR